LKILIVKTSAFGDVIHTFPVLSYLRKKFPDAQIDWVVEKPISHLVEAHPDVHRVYPIDSKQWRKLRSLGGFFHYRTQLRSERYDLVLDLQGNMKSGLVTFLAKAKEKVGFARESVSEWPNLLFTNKRYNPPKGLNIREDYLSIVQQHFGDCEQFEDPGVVLEVSEEQRKKIEDILAQSELREGKRVLVCPGSAWHNKQLPYETLRKVLQGMPGSSFLFLWGNDAEKVFAQSLQQEFPEKSIVIDRMDLPSLQNLMSSMDLVFSMDSLPLHLAGTTTTPTFSLFGASSAEKYRPKGVQHCSLQGECPYGRTFEKRCPVLRTCPTGACIRELTSEQVLEAYDCPQGFGVR